ncbi:hypothetical protein KQI77_02420 [Clostridium sp. MSJ-8]|uniref:hypothetical protein n=1 Tax=Clostridium sp. MSJ-8 TaxID=2841510 RepID=UPI001C0EAC0B|nr:hypothetical protein [Clostridium sp. MSJ-8]MBU5487016.1 hypothetical protein [Clostridium sp. MSJ-8]
MIVLLKLLEKNNDYVIYEYGYDEDNLDGKIEVSLNNPNKYKLLKESNDKHIGKKGTLIAINKVIKAVKNNEIRELLSYQS